MHRKKLLLLFVVATYIGAVTTLIILHQGPSLTQEQQQTFQKANQFNHNQQFTEAITQYQTLLQQGVDTANIHNNLAIAYSQTGNIGKSILHLEKAKQLDPYDRNIQNNLTKEQKDHTIPPQIKTSIWQNISLLLSTSHWITLASSTLLTLTLFSILHWTHLLQTRSLTQITVFILGIISISATLLAAQYRHTTLQHRAIVLTPESIVRLSPFPEANPIATLSAGTSIKIQPGKTHKNYVLVNLDTGQKGWLKKQDASLIQER